MIAVGVLLVLIDLVLHLRPAAKVDVNPVERRHARVAAARQLRRAQHSRASTGAIRSGIGPSCATKSTAGQHYLPGTMTGTRETIVTSAVEARPEFLLRLPGPSWLPMLAGIGTAAFFFALTVKFTWMALAGAALALVCIFRWLWEGDPAPSGKRHAVGGGVELPDYMSGVALARLVGSDRAVARERLDLRELRVLLVLPRLHGR